MPSTFPSAAHDGVTECVGTHNQTYPDAFGEFAGGWSAVGYRYLACSESDHEQAEQIAEWLEREMGRPVTVERVEPGDEQILPDAEQRELDALPSRLDCQSVAGT